MKRVTLTQGTVLVCRKERSPSPRCGVRELRTAALNEGSGGRRRISWATFTCKAQKQETQR